MSELYKSLMEKNTELESQLTASQARVKELEWQVADHELLNGCEWSIALRQAHGDVEAAKQVVIAKYVGELAVANERIATLEQALRESQGALENVMKEHLETTLEVSETGYSEGFCLGSQQGPHHNLKRVERKGGKGTMIPEQMRIVIAEECGWKRELKYEASFSDPKKEIGHEEWKAPTGYWTRVLPDYCNDLNAMHEAENWIYLGDYQAHLPMRERKDFNYLYRLTLTEIVGFNIHRATALQRAEAFIKTVCPEKWTDD